MRIDATKKKANCLFESPGSVLGACAKEKEMLRLVREYPRGTTAAGKQSRGSVHAQTKKAPAAKRQPGLG